MRNYKDRTVEQLCALINYLEDTGCLTAEDKAAYGEIMADYSAEVATEEILDKCLPDGYAHYSNCYILRDIEDGEVVIKGYDNDKSEVMMRDVSKHICFADCDGTWEVIRIVYHGREVIYTGWQPGMVMSYDYAETGDEAWSGCFPEYDH